MTRTLRNLDLFAQELKFYTIDLIKLVRAFFPLILKSKEKKVIFMTSIISSKEYAGNWPDMSYGYCVSKAAMNMLVRKWGLTLEQEGKGVVMVLVHPGAPSLSQTGHRGKGLRRVGYVSL